MELMNTSLKDVNTLEKKKKKFNLKKVILEGELT